MNKLIVLAAYFLCVAQGFATTIHKLISDDPDEKARSLTTHRPVLFQENKGQLRTINGQAATSVLFRAASKGMDVYITMQGLTYVFSKTDPTPKDVENPEAPTNMSMEWVNVHLEGASILEKNIVKELPGPTLTNFFLPSAPQGIYGVREYEKITIQDVYPGVDWVIYGSNTTGMKYDFIVHPGADASLIHLVYESEQPVALDSLGNIQLKTRLGSLTEHAPVSFTQDDHKEVTSSFKTELINPNSVRVTYTFGNYPAQQALVIDPQLTWGTRYGGSGRDVLRGSTHDSNNNIYIVGSTLSGNFPVMSSGSYFQNVIADWSDAFILKFDPNGQLIWATYYGGDRGDAAYSVACDGNDNVFVGGTTLSTNLPIQNSGTFFQDAQISNFLDLFFLKFDNSGNRLWATYYGGSIDEHIGMITCDPNGNLFAAGDTWSPDFQVQSSGGFLQPAKSLSHDGYILKFDNNGNRLWSTFYGGNAWEQFNSITCDPTGNIFVIGFTSSTNFPVQDAGTFFQGNLSGGRDACILKFDNTGNRIWATYCGGIGGGPTAEEGNSIAADQNGNVFVVGRTTSVDFPVQNSGTYFDGALNGASDAFILKFDNSGNRLWGTYYGGSGRDNWGWNTWHSTDRIALDNCGNIYVAMETHSTDITTLNPNNGSYFNGTYTGGASLDSSGIFMTRFTNNGTLLWATHIGNTEPDAYNCIEIDNDNNLLLAGSWINYSGGDLILNPGNGAYFDPQSDNSADGYILKFAFNDIPTYTSSQTPAGCNCSGTAVVNVSPTGFPPYTYTWSNGKQTIGTVNMADTASNLCAGSYWVEIVSCSERDTVFFTIVPGQPPVAAFSTNDTIICAESCINFTATAVNGASYSWDFGDGITGIQPNPLHCYNTAGNYTVSLIVTDATTCSDTLIRDNYIDVYPVPVAAIKADPTLTDIYHSTVHFTEQATGENSWYWYFDDALSGESTLPNTFYTYQEVGSYNASLVVTNTFLCTDTAFIVIQITDKFVFFLPNTFTPDDNGLNDLWFPEGKAIDPSVYELSLFNRWGERIWYTNNWGEGWNGMAGNGIAPDGTYTWTAIVKPEREMPREYSGHLILVR